MAYEAGIGQVSLESARTAYLKHPTRAALRLYLIQKAKRGRWDSRYCRYYGLSPDVNAACKEFITRGYAVGLVPTSTTRWPLSNSGSYHQRRNERAEGMAVDLGLIERHIGTKYGTDKMANFQRKEHRAFVAGKRKNMLELIGPDNRATILRGVQTDLGEGTALETQHDTHVHGAFR